MMTPEKIQAVLDERLEWGDMSDFFDEVNYKFRTISVDPGKLEIVEVEWRGIVRRDKDEIRNGHVQVSTSEWSIDHSTLDILSVWLRFKQLGWVE